MATRYIDVTKETSTLTGAWSCAAASNAWSEDTTSGNAVAELNVNDWICISATQKAWYKVSAVTDDDNFTTVENVNADVEAVAGATVATNTENGQAVGTPYGSIRQCLDKEAQAAGDLWHVRGGQSEYMADLSSIVLFETDGTSAAYIEVRTDTSGDIFSDATPGRTIWYFKKARSTMMSLTQDYIKIGGIKTACYGTGDNRFTHYAPNGHNQFLDNLFCSQIGGAEGDGGVISITTGTSHFTTFTDCGFEGNSVTIGTDDRGTSDIYDFIRCRFFGTSYGINQSGGAALRMVDCKFGIDLDGASDPCTTGITSSNTYMFMRNTEFDCTTDIVYADDTMRGAAYIEDYDAVRGNHKQLFNQGIIDSDTATVRSGGGDTSAKMTPGSIVNANKPLVFGEHPFDIPVKITSGAERTITMYVYANSWASRPSASQLYMEVAYYDGATSTRAIATSTEAVVADDTWTALTVAVTPNVTSLAYCRIYLKLYEAGSEFIYVDPVPVVS